MKRHGFTLVELLVVIAMIALLIALLIPSLAAVTEAVRRSNCRSHLSGLGKAMAAFASDNPMKDRWPDAGWGSGTTINTTGSMWLLVTRGIVQPENFVCPTDVVDGKAAAFTGVPDPRVPFPKDSLGRVSISYSYTVPHNSGGYIRNPGQEYGYEAERAVMADRSPFDTPPSPARGRLVTNCTGWASFGLATGNFTTATPAQLQQYCVMRSRYKIGSNLVTPMTTPQAAYLNSDNHRAEGQNVLYRDGHVAWCQSPMVGSNGDNIYTAWDTTTYTTATDCRQRAVGRTGNTIPAADVRDSWLRTYP